MMDLESLFVNTPSAALCKNKLREYPHCPLRGRGRQDGRQICALGDQPEQPRFNHPACLFLALFHKFDNLEFSGDNIDGTSL